MSGITGGESWRRPVGQFAKYLVVCFGTLAGIVVLVLALTDSLSLHALSLGFYCAGGLVAVGYVVSMLGAISAVGPPGLPPPYTYYPLDTDLIRPRRFSDDAQEIALLAFALLALFWGGGFAMELLA